MISPGFDRSLKPGLDGMFLLQVSPTGFSYKSYVLWDVPVHTVGFSHRFLFNFWGSDLTNDIIFTIIHVRPTFCFLNGSLIDNQGGVCF